MYDNSAELSRLGRRVVVGTNAAGASTVARDDENLPLTELANGMILREVWQQRNIPAGRNDEPRPDWALGPDAPTSGAVIRILTVPAGHGSHPMQPDLHTDPSLHVITMLAGELTVLLQEGEVRLVAGDSIILRDSMHDLRNEQTRPASFVYTSFPLAEG